MDILAGVLFQMQPGNAHRFWPPLQRVTGGVTFGSHDLQHAVSRKRLVVLRNLVPLRQIGIKIILTREDRLLIDVQAQSECSSGAKLDGVTIQYWEGTWQSQTSGTGIGIWFVAKTRGTTTKDF